ncbi:MAG: hypothetical protein ACU0GG_10215 [Paracoccaceae bacterium]
MATYIVTYDLNKETKRPPIVKEVKSFGSWARLSESSYAISTTSSPKQVYEKLSKHLDGNDSCYIITLSKPYWGQGPRDVNEWLDNNLPAKVA